jgi:hypothetical protein
MITFFSAFSMKRLHGLQKQRQQQMDGDSGKRREWEIEKKLK